MKKVVLSLSMLLFVAGGAMAQSKRPSKAAAKPAPISATLVKDGKATPIASTEAPTPASADQMVFVTDTHDFGTVAEGPAADFEFEFKNTGKEPIVLERVQASCGCTTPSYSKEPVLPGQSGSIKASYNTQGRPGPFTKTITAYVKGGATKQLTIKGNVEKGPEGSVPENNSMIKTH